MIKHKHEQKQKLFHYFYIKHTVTKKTKDTSTPFVLRYICFISQGQKKWALTKLKEKSFKNVVAYFLWTWNLNKKVVQGCHLIISFFQVHSFTIRVCLIYLVQFLEEPKSNLFKVRNHYPFIFFLCGSIKRIEIKF